MIVVHECDLLWCTATLDAYDIDCRFSINTSVIFLITIQYSLC